MAVPGLVRAALFHIIIIAWNGFLFGLLLTMHKAVAFTVGLARFQAEGATSGTCRPRR